MSGTPTNIMLLAGAAGWGLTLLVELAFIVLVATSVRRQRPDAAPILLLALGLDLLFTLASFIAQMAIPRLVSVSGDMTGYAELQAISTIAASLGHATSRALLIWGVVRLAGERSA